LAAALITSDCKSNCETNEQASWLHPMLIFLLCDPLDEYLWVLTFYWGEKCEKR
jgi:hypothetical protein